MRLLARALPLLLGLAPVGCGPAPQIDLAALLPAAEVVTLERELAGLDLPSPEAHPRLLSGWAPTPGHDAEHDVGFVESRGESSTLELEVGETASARLRFRCRQSPPVPGTRLAIRVNGTLVKTRPIGREWDTYKANVPAEVLRVGRNRVELRYDRDPAARRRDAEGDATPPGIALDSIRLVTRDERPRRRGDALFLPYRARVDYYLELPSGGALTLDRVRGEPGDRLEVFSEFGAEGSRSDALPVSDAAARLELEGGPGWRTRLRLSARAARPGSGGGLWLDRPRVEPRPDPARDARPRPPDVIVYLVDTLRADHLGAYGYARPTSPAIDAFAAEGAVFENAVAQSPWTRPSVASIFTGLHPSAHRVEGREHALPDQAVTLAEVLRRRGYQTAAFITNGNVSDAFGFRQGFETFTYLNESRERPSIHQLSDRVNDAVIEWLEGVDAARPIFLYVHTSDPHGPYTPPQPFRAQFAASAPEGLGTLEWLEYRSGSEAASALGDLLDLYDAEVAFNDQQFGRLLEELQRRGRYRESLVVLVSDHGEEFLEHGGLQHGKTLYGEVVQVPLITRFPERLAVAPARVGALVEQIDLFETVLDVVEIPLPGRPRGRSLLAAARRNGGSNGARAFTFVDRNRNRAQGVIEGDWKLIRSLRGRRTGLELYRLDEDGGEQENRAGASPQVAERLARELDLHLESAAALAPQRVPIEDALRKRLEALGYLR